MKRMFQLGCIPLVCILISGCWSSKEIEHMVYVNGSAVDYKNGHVIFYAQVIDFSHIAKKESGGEKGPSTIWVGKGEGKTVNEAVFDLYHTASQRIYWGQMKHFLFTEAAFKHGLMKETFDEFQRYSELRPTVWIFGIKNIENFSTPPTPIFNLSPLFAKTNDPVDTYRQSSLVRPTQAFRMEMEMNEPGKTVLLLGLKVDDLTWTEGGKKHTTIRKDGIYLLQNGKYKGWLPERSALGIRWMQPTTNRVNLPVPEDNPQVALLIDKPKPEIIPILGQGKPQFKIRVAVQGTVGEFKKHMNKQDILDQATKQIKHEIRTTYEEGLKRKADALQLSEVLYRKHLKEWKQYVVDGEFPLDKDSLQSIEVKLKLKSSSMLMMK